ncbi:protein SPEC3 [Ciona intestinalis]
MPMWCAVTCLFVNCLLPGFGTIMASFSVICCADVSQKNSGKGGTFCLNFWVGWLQMITLFFVLFGWVWSIVWGVAFVQAAAKRNNTMVTTTTTNTMYPDNPRLVNETLPGYAQPNYGANNPSYA